MKRGAPWILAIVSAAVAVGALVWALNVRRSLSDELARERGSAALLVKGVRVPHEETAVEMADGLARRPALGQQVAQLLAVSAGSTPVATAHGSTGGFTVGSPATVSGPSQPPAEGAQPLPGAVAAKPCLVEQGDMMEIVVDGAALKSVAGNYLVTATARLNWISRTTGQSVTIMDAVPLQLEVGVLKQP